MPLPLLHPVRVAISRFVPLYCWRRCACQSQMRNRAIVHFQILKMLLDVRVERSNELFDDKKRWAVKLIFEFGDNDFMEQTELTKTYLFADAGESIAAGAQGCAITWRGRCGTVAPCLCTDRDMQHFCK